jgi:hypothetical protein
MLGGRRKKIFYRKNVSGENEVEIFIRNQFGDAPCPELRRERYIVIGRS